MQRIPASGPCLVVSHEPLGPVADFVRSVRRDVFLHDGGLASLEQGGVLIRRPADVPAAFLNVPDLAIVPVNAQQTPRAGSRVSAAALLSLPSDRDRAKHLRWRISTLATRPRNHRRAATLEPLAEPRAPETLAAEVAGLAESACLATAGGLRVYLARAAEIPAVLDEIGRLREISFRADDEGTGRARDLDPFDDTYLHLFAWNPKTSEIVGAYRLAETDRVRDGLYTATLFEYGGDFLDRLGPAIELGRSFIRPEYQKSFAALLALWKGIGAFLAAHPRYRKLFGPVSISRRYSPLSRQLMVACLERWASFEALARLVRARNPFQRGPVSKQAGAIGLDELSGVVADVESDGAGIPVLLRHYLKLGGRLLRFNVDAAFSDVVDGLIVVDLNQTEPRLLARYLGEDYRKAMMA